ncbi:hypothetical protein [Tersicoccus sp. Bi-70]|uniref:hypothetical protein n=1 Tax=Tersicoccus sp. Bi-70 TaxID=1897634 RepID=UPI0009761601|nr:hypothetical protein [Tersicoccus sp. Bi-70]OMH36877.1 hypothetical protein BGP79_14135 [Tersicoccus sp. Bi-70]
MNTTLTSPITTKETTMSTTSFRRLWLAATGFALAVGLAGCGATTSDAGTAPSSGSAGSAPASVAAPKPAAPAGPVVGNPFTADMGNGNVARITIVSAKYTTGAISQFASTPTNGGYLVLDVLWETEKGTTSANPLYFAAKDAQGRKVNAFLGADGQLGSGEVPVGDKTRGTVAFDIGQGPTTVIVTDPLLQEAARVPVKG